MINIRFPRNSGNNCATACLAALFLDSAIRKRGEGDTTVSIFFRLGNLMRYESSNVDEETNDLHNSMAGLLGQRPGTEIEFEQLLISVNNSLLRPLTILHHLGNQSFRVPTDENGQQEDEFIVVVRGTYRPDIHNYMLTLAVRLMDHHYYFFFLHNYTWYRYNGFGSGIARREPLPEYVEGDQTQICYYRRL